MNKYYMIPNSKDFSKYKEELILPLKNYSIGFDEYFSVDEIISIKDRKVNVIINKFLHNKDLNNIKKIIKELTNVSLFFIEDLSLLNIIEKNRIVLFQNHIINNYDSINYFKDNGISNIVVSNELTINELKTIEEKTTSNLFYFLIARNNIMYSKRNLLSSYYKHKNINKENAKIIEEKISKKKLIIKEENNSTVIFNDGIFSANSEIDNLERFSFIINLSNLDEEETNVILNHYKDLNLSKFITIDNYFLYNDIKYKVGEL